MRLLWLASTHPILIGSIVPAEGESPKFAQIYFIDNQDSEVATRCAIVDGLKPDIIRGINQLLHESHHYVEVFKVAKGIFEQEPVPTNVKGVINEAKSHQGSILEGTIGLLVMRWVY